MQATFDLNHAVRIRNFDSVVFQSIPDQEQHIGGVFVGAVINTVDPEFHSEINATVTEAAQLAIGRIG